MLYRRLSGGHNGNIRVGLMVNVDRKHTTEMTEYSKKIVDLMKKHPIILSLDLDGTVFMIHTVNPNDTRSLFTEVEIGKHFGKPITELQYDWKPVLETVKLRWGLSSDESILSPAAECLLTAIKDAGLGGQVVINTNNYPGYVFEILSQEGELGRWMIESIRFVRGKDASIRPGAVTEVWRYNSVQNMYVKQVGVMVVPLEGKVVHVDDNPDFSSLERDALPVQLYPGNFQSHSHYLKSRVKNGMMCVTSLFGITAETLASIRRKCVNEVCVDKDRQDSYSPLFNMSKALSEREDFDEGSGFLKTGTVSVQYNCDDGYYSVEVADRCKISFDLLTNTLSIWDPKDKQTLPRELRVCGEANASLAMIKDALQHSAPGVLHSKMRVATTQCLYNGYVGIYTIDVTPACRISFQLFGNTLRIWNPQDQETSPQEFQIKGMAAY